MLARQREVEDSNEVQPGRLKLVGERLLGPRNEAPAEEQQPPKRSVFGNAIYRLREEIRLDPERYAHLGDRLILLGIAIVVIVAAYLVIVDPG